MGKFVKLFKWGRVTLRSIIVVKNSGFFPVFLNWSLLINGTTVKLLYDSILANLVDLLATASILIRRNNIFACMFSAFFKTIWAAPYIHKLLLFEPRRNKPQFHLLHRSIRFHRIEFWLSFLDRPISSLIWLGNHFGPHLQRKRWKFEKYW